MKLHREGNATILIILLFLSILNAIVYYTTYHITPYILYAILILSLGFFLFILSFFRVPNRILTLDENLIVSPADGEIVVIERVFDNEYFKDERIQISIFMSPLNVHQNLSPSNGSIIYSQYHKGKYLVAFNPKSSTENERHSIVIKTERGVEILVKQIAGAVARRIVNYAEVEKKLQQGKEFGFIKFGSRVDVLLPLDTTIKTKLKQKVKGGISVLGELN